LASSYNLRENFLEETFILQKHLGMSYSDIRDLPLVYRRWFIERIVTHHKRMQSKSSSNSNSKKYDSNLMGVAKVPNSKENAEDLKKVERFFKKFSK
jgi:hypothetical protein